MRFQDTFARCTALNSLAALEDLAAIRTKQKRGERRNVPALPSRAQHVFSAEPQDKQHTDVGYRQIQRRQGRLLFYPFLLCLPSLLFILFDKK